MSLVHVSDPVGTFWLPDQMGPGGAVLDFDSDGDLDLYVVDYIDRDAQQERPCYDPRGLSDYCSPVVYQAPAVDRLFRGGPQNTFVDATILDGNLDGIVVNGAVNRSVTLQQGTAS